MNPLVALKEKLMIKPNVEERERVAVIVKGTRKPRKIETTAEEEIVEEKEGPLIEMQTDKEFDRAALLTRLAENKKLKVTIKPILEVTEEKKVSEPIPMAEPLNKAKMLTAKKRIIIEPEDEDLVEVNMDENEEGALVLKPKNEQQIIPIKVPKKKTRITGKIEKGIAILGPETIVEIGDTDLRRRLPKKEPPVIIKVSSYYMNNREIFVNFINSLFEPYRQELLENEESISCDVIGKTNTNFSLLTHQRIVRD